MSIRRLVPARVKRYVRERVLGPRVAAALEKQASYEQRRAEKIRAAERRRVPSWGRSEAPGPKALVRVGFVGAGEYAQHHLRALASYESVELAALLTTGGPAAKDVAQRHGVERVFTDVDAFVAQDDVDCFVVVVPVHALFDVALRCVRAGRPVLMEKPPGVTSAQTRQLADAARSAGTWGMVGVNRRFLSLVEHGLAALADLGAVRGAILEVPQPLSVHLAAKRLSQFEQDNYYVANSIHAVDLLRFVLGDPVAVHSLAWPNDEYARRGAAFSALLDYGNGVQATVLDLWDTPDQERLKVIAEQGSVTWEPTRRGWVEKQRGRHDPISIDPVDEEFRPGTWAQDLHFVEAVRAGRPPAMPASTLDDAVGTMELMERILAGSLGSTPAGWPGDTSTGRFKSRPGPP